MSGDEDDIHRDKITPAFVNAHKAYLPVYETVEDEIYRSGGLSEDDIKSIKALAERILDTGVFEENIGKEEFKAIVSEEYRKFLAEYGIPFEFKDFFLAYCAHPVGARVMYARMMEITPEEANKVFKADIRRKFEYVRSCATKNSLPL